MAGNLLTIDVDASGLLRAFAALPSAVQAHVVERAALETARRIQQEARARVRRRTGETAKGIVILGTPSGDGWMVLATRQHMPNLPIWIEFGTWKWVAAPFLFSSARVEEDPHLQRVAAALQDAIDAVS